MTIEINPTPIQPEEKVLTEEPRKEIPQPPVHVEEAEVEVPEEPEVKTE